MSLGAILRCYWGWLWLFSFPGAAGIPGLIWRGGWACIHCGSTPRLPAVRVASFMTPHTDTLVFHLRLPRGRAEPNYRALLLLGLWCWTPHWLRSVVLLVTCGWCRYLYYTHRELTIHLPPALLCHFAPYWTHLFHPNSRYLWFTLLLTSLYLVTSCFPWLDIYLYI